jgi:ELMO domain-containing protein
MQLWENLRPGEKLEDRKTAQWIDIGFQGKDPSTDFRGAGILGLKQLLAITSRKYQFHSRAIEIYDGSTQTEHWFFFACAGLNITQKLLVTLNEDCDEKLTLLLMKTDFKKVKMFEIFTALYFQCFVRFSQRWQEQRPGIMQFTQFLDQVYEEDFLPVMDQIA